MKNDETKHSVIYFIGENYKIKQEMTQETLADLLKRDDITLISVNATPYYRRPGRKKAQTNKQKGG